MKKILVATDNYLPRWDGVARFLYEVLPALSKKYEITVLHPRFRGKPIKIEGVKTIPVKTFKFSVNDYNPSHLNVATIRKAVADCDLVFAQALGPLTFTSVFYAKSLGKPVVSYIHCIDWELYEKSLKLHRFIRKTINVLSKNVAKYFYNSADMLLVPYRELSSILNSEDMKVKKRVVHLGTDTDEFSPTKDRTKSKKKIGLSKDDFVIGFAGRVGREKDLPSLYKAFEVLSRAHKDLKLLIVGKGVKDLMRHKNKNIIFKGNVNNVADYMKAMDIFVMPSLTETSSLVTLEAMSCGLPVVATPAGQIKHYVKDGKNGMIFPFKDTNTLIRKIDKLINDRALRERMGKSARITITKKYHWNKTIEELLDVFSKII